MPDSSIGPPDRIVSKVTAGSVDDAVAELTRQIEQKGMKLFSIIDHSGEAREVGLELRDTKVVVFGSPAAGTPVMDNSPLVALDLPLRVLVWDDLGRTTLSYTAPDELARRHGLRAEVAARLAGIGPLTDAAIT